MTHCILHIRCCIEVLNPIQSYRFRSILISSFHTNAYTLQMFLFRLVSCARTTRLCAHGCVCVFYLCFYLIFHSRSFWVLKDCARHILIGIIFNLSVHSQFSVFFSLSPSISFSISPSFQVGYWMTACLHYRIGYEKDIPFLCWIFFFLSSNVPPPLLCSLYVVQSYNPISQFDFETKMTIEMRLSIYLS